MLYLDLLEKRVLSQILNSCKNVSCLSLLLAFSSPLLEKQLTPLVPLSLVSHPPLVKTLPNAILS